MLSFAFRLILSTITDETSLMTTDERRDRGMIMMIPSRIPYRGPKSIILSRTLYRAIHFSAKRGLAIACRPSVCRSVTLVDCDHIGWNKNRAYFTVSWRGAFALCRPKHHGPWIYSKGSYRKFGPKVTHPLLI